MGVRVTCPLHDGQPAACPICSVLTARILADLGGRARCAGCGTVLRAHAVGRPAQHCSPRCYGRIYMRARRAAQREMAETEAAQ